MTNKKLSAWDISTLFVTIPVALPIIVVLTALFSVQTDIWNHLLTTVLGDYLRNTLLLMFAVGVLSLLIGVPTAWLTARYQFPGSRLFPVLLMLPLAAPAYVVGYVYADLLDYTGPLQTLLRGWGISELPPIRSLTGAALVIAFVLYPYIYLLARVSFSQQTINHIEAARTLGAGSSRVFFKVVLPMARPAIFGGLALVLMETVADYGVVEHYGVQTFTTGIFRTWFAMGEPQGALQLAGCLFVIAAILVTLEDISRRGQTTNPVKPTPSKPLILRTWKGWLAFLICTVPVVIGFVVPMTSLFWDAIMAGDSMGAVELMALMGNTLLVASIAAFCCLIAAVWLSYAARRTDHPLVRTGIRIATLGYAIPGMVLAVGLLEPLTALDRGLATAVLETTDINIGLVISGSLTGLVLVYMARFLTVAFNNVQSSLLQINRRYDEVASTLGAGSVRILQRVHLPLLRPGMAAALLIVLVDVIKELPATLVLRPFNFDTLATRVYRLASDERLAEASIAAILIVLLGLLPTILLSRTLKR